MDGPQLLAHVGGHEKTHLIHAGGIQAAGAGFWEKGGLKAHPGHIQPLQLGLNSALGHVGGLPAGLGKRLRPLSGFGGSALQLFLQAGDPVLRELDSVQLRPAGFKIRKHFLRRAAVLLFQAIEYIQPSLHLVQLVGRHVQPIPGLTHQLGGVLGGIAQLGELVRQFLELPPHGRNAGQGTLCVGQQRGGPVPVLVSPQGGVSLLYRLQQLARVAQEVAAAQQSLILPRLQVGLLQLPDLIGEGVHPPGFFRLVHLQGGDFPL
ncbi:hypothetical protein SDC9_131782 [bioreactor metagenome]|uniref:Uncharacterized protein n=1 Tax=bioreactor metagenome TaxID=1076179 RepID=A0A645D678_9ZZZZ